LWLRCQHAVYAFLLSHIFLLYLYFLCSAFVVLYFQFIFVLSLPLSLPLSPLHPAGLSCDRCEFGFWNRSQPDGCVPCDCDPRGSLSAYCEQRGGQCACRPGVGGLRCTSCGRGTYGLGLDGSCLPCNCSAAGTVGGAAECDPHTGQCVCKVRAADWNTLSLQIHHFFNLDYFGVFQRTYGEYNAAYMRENYCRCMFLSMLFDLTFLQCPLLLPPLL